jgi:hypothetical protein
MELDWYSMCVSTCMELDWYLWYSVCVYLYGAGLVLVVLCVGLEVIYIYSGQARYEQLQLLLCEDGDQPLGDDLVETLQIG